MIPIDEILQRGKERRRDEKRRRDTIHAFRRDAERSSWWAAAYSFMAMAQGAAAYFFLRAHRADHDLWIVAEFVVMVAVTSMWLGMAVRKLWVSPRDRLLLLLIDEALSGEGSATATSSAARSVAPEFLDAASPYR